MMPLTIRRWGRRFRRELALVKHRWRRTGRPKVVFHPARIPAEPATHPAVTVVPPPGVDPETMVSALGRQTERSWVVSTDDPPETPWVWCPGPGVEQADPVLLESLVLSAAALDVEAVIPGDRIADTSDDVDPGVLLRRPATGRKVRSGVVGSVVPTSTDDPTLGPPPASALHHRDGFLLDAAGLERPVIRHPVDDVDTRLAALPPVEGRPTILFLAPFLAVGGAERLLFDLIEGLTGNHRILVATLDVHRRELGNTLDRCRRLTPHVYALGDWLPREARIPALHHLIRRWQVDCLVSWNGTVDFYDHALDIKERHPGLRIFAQLYNHEGGWLNRSSRALLRRLDGHIGINERISRALIERGAPADRVHTIHHGVRIPDSAPEEEQIRSHRAIRARLGLPDDAVVAGTFIRLHRQKRPMDLIALARRMDGSGLHFLLVGGGPEEAAVRAEIQRNPPKNLTLLPMQDDPLPLYDAVDVCLMTSDYEGLPVFLLDGLAREIPCVATAVGEIPELLQDGGGTTVDQPGDLAALEAALLAFKDPERRRSEGRLGRRTVEGRFGLEAYVRAYRTVFDPEGRP